MSQKLDEIKNLIVESLSLLKHLHGARLCCQSRRRNYWGRTINHIKLPLMITHPE